MGKALIGTTVSPRTVQLLDEIRSLRQRVAVLEEALAEAEAARAAMLRDPELVGDRDEVVISG
jgi:cell division septum initiation protein DivIVA